jgi:hypothetical protein
MIRTPSSFGLQRILSRLTGAGTLIFGGAITTDKTKTIQNTTATLAELETAQTFTGAQAFQNATPITARQGATTDAIVIAPANVGSGSNAITDTTPATAIGANFVHTRQAKTGTVSLQETSTMHGFKNLLRNGRVEVDQRVTLTTPVNLAASTTTYGPDCWAGQCQAFFAVSTIGKVAVVNTPMTGSRSAVKLNCTAGNGLSATSGVSLWQAIEGTVFSRCNYGTAKAATLYYSFWAESTTTGTFSIALRNGTNARSYVINHTISAANTRQLFQGSFPGDTSGTWATDTTAAASISISVMVGSTYQTTAGAWQAGNFLGTSSNANFFSAVNSFTVSDVYLGTEPIGTATTDYPHIPFPAELALCQRYYAIVYFNNRSYLIASALNDAQIYWPTTMRVAPTTNLIAGGRSNVALATLASQTTDGCRHEIVSIAAGDTYALDELVTASAEL